MNTMGEVLVVDDKPENIQVVGSLLRNEGYHVRAASSGKAALESAAFKSPDLILLDVSMPEMDGFETCRRFKQIPSLRDVPILFLTAERRGVESFVAGIAAGGLDFIEKPVDSAILLARVQVHASLHRMRIELDLRNDKLVKANAWKARLLSVLSHDLRNPVSSFGSVVSLLIEEYDVMSDATRKEFLSELRNAGYNTYEMLDTILGWVRTSQDDPDAVIDEFSANECIVAVLNQYSSTAKRKNIRLTAEVDDALLVRGDRNMTETVIRNLVSNALKFCASGAQVSVAGRRTGGSVLIEVSDTGVGIPEERLSSLFLEYAKSTRGTAGENGTGLGLVMCRDLMARQGGTISAQSVVGVGSRFSLTLPSGSPAPGNRPV